MNLFLDNLPEHDDEFRKEAGFISKLSETPENWPQELTSELFKQLPYLSDYDVNVNLAKVEPQRGYAFGYADVANKTERPELEHDEAGLPHIRIPLIVQDRAAKPFSTFLDGEKVLPLSEDRVRDTLFNPGTFDLSTSQPRDPSLVEPLMPPQRSGMGMGGEYKMASAQTKTAGIKDRAAKYVADVGEDAVKRVMKKHTNKAIGAAAAIVAGTGGAAYLGAKAGSKSKTAAMEGAGGHFEGDGGVSEVVDMWLEKLKKHNARPIPTEETEKVAMVKEAFNHISKPQWDAIYKSDAIQKLVQKHGTMAHPEITNRVYEIAAKTYGFHPKVYSKSPEMKAQEAKAAIDKSEQKPAPKNKTASLLQAIAPTIRQRDRDAFVEKVASDATLRAGFNRSGITSRLIEVMDTEKRASAAEMLMSVAERIAPTTVTLQKLPGGDFFVKSANVGAFSQSSAEGQVIPGAEAAEAIGQEQALAMQPGQSATAVAEPVEETPLFESNEKVVEEFGEYLVRDTMGNRVMGWVFPTTLAWDGNFTPQPMALFTNGSAYALQDTIAGELAGKSTMLPDTQPLGDGVFYLTENGKAVCTAPITIGSAAAGPDGNPIFMGQDIFGNPVQIHLTEGITTPTRVTDVEYAFPKSWKFMRLNGQTQLASQPGDMMKAAAVRSAQTEVELIYNGSFHLRGGCGLSKVASHLRTDLDPLSAEFMLGVLGVDGTRVKSKLAEARKKGSIKLAGLKTIHLLSEKFAEEVKTASALLSKIPDLRRDLTKEAAALEDESTVDNLLALNFINPENLSTFISYVPELEETSEKLAEMLLSNYLGMNELPEGALERGMKNLEEVVTSLKSLQHSES